MIKSTERADIIVEYIEVYLNQILYLRDMYPTQIFKKHKLYNAPVFASVFPPLNAYLSNVLLAVKQLLIPESGDDNGCLKRVELIFYTGDDTIFERHMFEIFDFSKTQGFADDSFLLYFEEEIRKSLYKMPERMKLLKKLPHETKMTIRLHTSQNGQMMLQSQEFPWLQSSEKAFVDETKKWYLLPLASVQNLGLNLLTEVCNV